MTKPISKSGKRAKTGVARLTRQPFNLDRLPPVVHQAIEQLRDPGGKTWVQIAKQSARPYSKDFLTDGGGFIDWDSLETPVLELFPECRLNTSSLQRWFDVRIEQAREQTLAEGKAAREFAQLFASTGIEGGNEAVVNAMRDQVFALARSSAVGDRVMFIKGLNQLTLAMMRMERLTLSKRKIEAEIAKSETDRARIAAQSGDPREVYMQAVVDLLKKLRTRDAVRAVLDPIKDELVQEMSNGAEAFARQIEASAA
jgi:hypothetical protein